MIEKNSVKRIRFGTQKGMKGDYKGNKNYLHGLTISVNGY